MRKQVLRLLRVEFSHLLLGRFAMFRKDPVFKTSFGDDLYVWRFSSELSFFIYLLPNPRSYLDSFMVELGWSKRDYPMRAPLQHGSRPDTNSDGRIRLPNLWREEWASAREPWWEVGAPLMASDDVDDFFSEQETLQRTKAVPKVVINAMDRIEKYAIPFFKSIAVARRTTGVQ